MTNFGSIICQRSGNLISNPDPKPNPSPTLLAALTNPSDYPFGTKLYGK